MQWRIPQFIRFLYFISPRLHGNICIAFQGEAESGLLSTRFDFVLGRTRPIQLNRGWILHERLPGKFISCEFSKTSHRSSR